MSILYSCLLLVGSLFIFSISVHAASSVVINEIQTTGTQDADDEFIELWNGSDATIALDEWSLQYKTATGTTTTKRNFEKGAAISAQGYYLIATKEYKGSTTPDLIQSSINLAKSGGNLSLVRNQEVITSKDDPDIVDRIAWGTGDSAEGSAATSPDTGQSIERQDRADTENNANDFVLRIVPTPTNSKSVTPTNEPTVSSPSANTSTTTDTALKKETPSKTKNEKTAIAISEILPNPLGSDEDEFIEIVNMSENALPLSGWRLTNRLDQVYFFTEVTLAPKTYLVLTRAQSKLALQNDREELRLFAPKSERAAELVKYTNAPDGESLARNPDDDMRWTTTPTPGDVNVFTMRRRAPIIIIDAPKEGTVGDILSFDASDSFDPDGEALTMHWDFGDALGKGEGSQVTYIYLKSGTFTITLTVKDTEGLTTIKTEKIKISGEDLLAEKEETITNSNKFAEQNDEHPTSTPSAAIKLSTDNFIAATKKQQRASRQPLISGTIRGVVTVPPGVLAKTYGYLLCESPCAGEGVKIRMTKAQWPELKKGDVVILSGKASTAGNEPSFLVKKEGVRITGTHKKISPEPLPSFRELDDTLLRHFVIASGEITEKKKGGLYLDDGSGELSVTTRASPLIAEGDEIAIAGILTKGIKGFVLKASEPATVINAQPKITKESKRIVRDKENEQKKYIAVTVAALLAIAAKPAWDFGRRRFKRGGDADRSKEDRAA